MQKEYIRNFCIIAHIDHGKSTLADRLLEHTHTIPKEKMIDQILDDMDLERERGITIKSHAIRMKYQYNGKDYILNLIDTPGHVDFTYEVSRSLAACEGALLLVDASQGIEAQTISNLYLALDNDLEIIPVINKIDLPNVQTEQVKRDLIELLGISEQEILEISAREDIGIEQLLDSIIQYIPPPKYEENAPTTALIFDSQYDKYRGVIVLVRVFNGELRIGMSIKLFATQKEHIIEEIGYLELDREKGEKLAAGEVGYIFAGIKDVREAKVGDTITSLSNPASQPLPGFRHPKPMVFSGIYPLNGEDYENLLDALAKLQLNDSALTYEKESSLALGYGFRCGFLGLLHLEIFKERLNREYDIPIISTMPSVEFIVIKKNGEQIKIDNPFQMPSEDEIAETKEPIMECEIITPPEYIGNIVQLARQRRGLQKEIEYLDENRMLIHYEFPLIEIIFDFYDKLKSVSRGYASFDYRYKEHRSAPLVKVDILVNKEKVDAMSFITHKDKAYEWGKNITEKLREVIPRHLFTIPIQASNGSRVIARSTIKALRKNVTAKCYGGDVTRKKKLLERQKEGKKRMREIGSVRIPQDAFLAVLKAERT